MQRRFSSTKTRAAWTERRFSRTRRRAAWLNGVSPWTKNRAIGMKTSAAGLARTAQGLQTPGALTRAFSVSRPQRGRRGVATGGAVRSTAKPVESVHECITAPAGAEESPARRSHMRVIPLPLRGSVHLRLCPRVALEDSLHPWLHPIAPPGRKTLTVRGRSVSGTEEEGARQSQRRHCRGTSHGQDARATKRRTRPRLEGSPSSWHGGEQALQHPRDVRSPGREEPPSALWANAYAVLQRHGVQAVLTCVAPIEKR